MIYYDFCGAGIALGGVGIRFAAGRQGGCLRRMSVVVSEVDVLNRPYESEGEAGLRERLWRLSEASVRINESLDFDTVLQGALDSARSLTGARYGVMTLLDDGGRVEDFLASGMSAEEAEQLWQPPQRWEIFERVGSVPEPVRLPDLVGYVRSLGFAGFRLPLPESAGPVWPFLASQMFDGSERVGNIFWRDAPTGGVQPRGRTDPDHVRRPGGAGDRQRRPPPRRAARPDLPGDAGGHLPRGRGGVRHPHGSPQVHSVDEATIPLRETRHDTSVDRPAHPRGVAAPLTCPGPFPRAFRSKQEWQAHRRTKLAGLDTEQPNGR